MDNFIKRQRKELTAVAAGRDREDFLAMAEGSPEAADGVHRMLVKLDGLVPLSSVMQGVLARVNAMRVR